MSRSEEARRFLARWNPEGEELPDWVADAMDEDDSLAPSVDAHYQPWNGRALGIPASRPRLVAATARPSRRRVYGLVGLGLALAATATLFIGAPSREEPQHLEGLVINGKLRSLDGEDAPDDGYFTWKDSKSGKSKGTASTSRSISMDPELDMDRERSTDRAHIRERLWERQAARASDNTIDLPKAADLSKQPESETPPSAEGYTGYGINGFYTTATDPLSTFSIDVDTASYTLVRRKLREGYLPPREAVRVEEFVNYLPYDYDRPPDDAPFGVDVQGAPSPFGATTLLRVGIQGKRVPTDQRAAVHLTFLVDTSGSMQSDDKLGLVKTALKALTGELRDGDTVAIVAYAGSAGLVLPPTPMSRKGEVLFALDRLTAGGSTAMGAGISLAYQQAEASFQQGAVNRVIILSDGDANVGQTSHEALTESIRAYANKGITLTTAGFGEGNYKDTMMEQLANDGDGNYFYIDDEAQARRVFVDKLTSTLVVIAKDVKIQVDFDPDTVTSYRLLGYENRDIRDEDFRDDAVDAGEIGAGHQVTALYELVLREGAAGELGTVQVRNKAPGPDAPATERTYPIDTTMLRTSFSETDRDLRMAVASATFAELLRGSPYLSEVSYTAVAGIARSATRPEYPEDLELLGLIERAGALSRAR